MTKESPPNHTNLKLSPDQDLALSIYLAAGYDDEETVALCGPAKLTLDFVARYREAHGPQLELLRRKLHQRSLTAGLAVATERLRRLNHLAFLIERRLDISKEERHFGPLVGHYLDLFRHVHDITQDHNPPHPLDATASAQISPDFTEEDPEYQAALRALVRAADRIAADHSRKCLPDQPGTQTPPPVSRRNEVGEDQAAVARR